MVPKPIKLLLRPLRDRFLLPVFTHLVDLISLRSFARWEYRRYGLQRKAAALFMFLGRAVDLYHYQPLYGVGGKFSGTQHQTVRACTDRWAVINPELPATGFALDVGCQNGFFSFLMAKRGLVTVGVEKDETSVRVCQTLAIANELLPVSFLNMEVSVSTVRNLPGADVVLCLSIFHNWVRDLGFVEADRIMRIIARNTRSVLFFETGQSDQTEVGWAKELSFMGKNPEVWVEEYLKNIGFKHVKKIGTFSGNNKHSSERALFVAHKEAVK